MKEQEVVGSNAAWVACEVFFHRHSESTEYTVLCNGKIKSIVYHLMQEFHQPMKVKKFHSK